MYFVMNKNERAITLIALVITIIVIMILAGTSISMIMGQNGVISNSIQAKMKNELAEYKEQYNKYFLSNYFNFHTQILMFFLVASLSHTPHGL